MHDFYYAYPQTTIHIHQSSPIFQPVPGYQHDLASEIEQLKAINNSLEYNLAHLERINSSLRQENSDLSSKNRHLKRLIEELKNMSYCYDCQSHITICLHNL